MAKTKVVVRRPELDRATKCDKCGSYDIVYRTLDSSHVLCEKCAEEMAPILESLGYRPIKGWAGFITKLPKAMRLRTEPQEPKPKVVTKESLLVELIPAPPGKRIGSWKPGVKRIGSWGK